jgi:hypothetical protein
VPAVESGAPLVTGSAGATFSVTVDPHGLATTVDFEYGLDNSLRDAGGVIYDQQTAATTVPASAASQTVTATASGLIPNALYHVRAVAVNTAGTTDGPDQTFTTRKGPVPPPPVLGHSVNVIPVSGLVFVKVPTHGHARAAPVKGQGFIPLTEARQLPVGTEFDARKGSVAITAATGARKATQSGTFGGALFTTLQSARRSQRGLTTLKITESAFPGAPGYRQCTSAGKADAAGAYVAKALSKKVLQALKATAHGNFQTVGRYSAATVRGTSFTVSDRCNGTLTVVHRGLVLVTAPRHHRRILLHSGQHYLAKAP